MSVFFAVHAKVFLGKKFAAPDIAILHSFSRPGESPSYLIPRLSIHGQRQDIKFGRSRDTWGERASPTEDVFFTSRFEPKGSEADARKFPRLLFVKDLGCRSAFVYEIVLAFFSLSSPLTSWHDETTISASLLPSNSSKVQWRGARIAKKEKGFVGSWRGITHTFEKARFLSGGIKGL